MRVCSLCSLCGGWHQIVAMGVVHYSNFIAAAFCSWYYFIDWNVEDANVYNKCACVPCALSVEDGTKLWPWALFIIQILLQQLFALGTIS